LEGGELLFNDQEDVQLVLKELHGRDLPLLEGIASHISSLKCSSAVLQADAFLSFAPRCSRLQSLDLNETIQCPQGLWKFFPKLRTLNLSNCIWLEDAQLIEWLSFASGLFSLHLSGNRQLTFKSWKMLKELPGLNELVLFACQEIEDADFNFIALGCPRLTHLSVGGCGLLTDKSLLALTKHCRQLTKGDFSDCQGFTENGFIAFGTQPLPLRFLSVKNCANFGERALAAFLRGHPHLETLILTGCPIPSAVIKASQGMYPPIHFVL
jgi:hypothetical protein